MAAAAVPGEVQERQLHLATTNILCQGKFADRFFIGASDFFQYLSCIYKPLRLGCSCCLTASVSMTWRFHESQFAEDYLLSQKVARRKFAIVRGASSLPTGASKRWGICGSFSSSSRTALNTHNERFYLRDHKYWGAYRAKRPVLHRKFPKWQRLKAAENTLIRHG